jgi:aminodeoxyfutalosine deaminase
MGKGLSGFIGEMVEKREGNNEEISQSMVNADMEMYEEGIVAVGDISNSSVSLKQKAVSKIHYHTFVEIFDIFPERAQEVFNNGKSLQKIFADAGQRTSLVPHAPYTVSGELMKRISDYALETDSVLTIHNQETLSENEMFGKGTGSLIEKLRQIAKSYMHWQPSGKTSLSTCLDQINSEIPVQLVHNTFSGLEDIRLANQKMKSLFWCICANANLFIESVLPDIQLLSDEGCLLTIGTDSYASNTSLSVLNELKTISKYYRHIELADLLKWATLNGASFLEVDNELGSFDKEKTPGVNLITGLDLIELKLTGASKIQRIC